MTTLSSLALRDDLRSRDHYYPADDVSHSQVSRHVEQRAGVYETTRGAQGPVRESHGLRGVYLGHDQRVGHRQGKSGQASPNTSFLSLSLSSLCFSHSLSLSHLLIQLIWCGRGNASLSCEWYYVACVLVQTLHGARSVWCFEVDIFD